MLPESLLAEYSAEFEREGHVVVPGLFSEAETAALREHYMQLRAEGPKPGDMVATDPVSRDPLKKFPRMLQMHRWDSATVQWLIDPRLAQCLSAFFGAEPCAAQSMLYFKPAGARGQALHQDNWYLRVKPGTCIAAWMALDDCDRQNGCMQVVPGSHTWSILCPKQADTRLSFTSEATPLPEGASPAAIEMKAGDVLFFNGQLVHGSYPNETKDRFRRSLIGHYVDSRTQEMTANDLPVIRMDGTFADLRPAPGGGPCGVWVEEDGTPIIEMSGSRTSGAATE